MYISMNQEKLINHVYILFTVAEGAFSDLNSFYQIFCKIKVNL